MPKIVVGGVGTRKQSTAELVVHLDGDFKLLFTGKLRIEAGLARYRDIFRGAMSLHVS